MKLDRRIVEKLRSAISIQRLLETAVQLVEVPSPTRSAGKVADRLEEILRRDEFAVERVEAGWSDAPAVVARLETAGPGRTLQYNGHLDTVHLPFVPPRVEGGRLYGSGASDMKGGIAAAVEAMRAVRQSGLLGGGGLLLTAHDLHETPWGDGTQIDALIDAGYLGDGVLLPEYLCSCLPVAGRGLAVFSVEVSRDGQPVHEVLGGIEQPSVITAGAEVIQRFSTLDKELSRRTHPLAGRESMFVGQIASGEIYNQAPTQLTLAGTRRWLSGSKIDDVESRIREILSDVAGQCGTRIECRFQVARDAFELNPQDPLVVSVRSAYRAASGDELPLGAKPFVDDGNAFIRRGGVPAVTHGPDAKGAHTLHEEVPAAELERVALVYALSALAYCPPSET